ncbi:MAG: serine/threonine-protein kinase [Pseudomonadota bacterium]
MNDSGKNPQRESKYLPEGSMLEGKYRIISKLAEGGMGVVYKAEHTLMHKIVAIKRLHRDLMQFDQVCQRFEREAQAAAKIDHPNVCAVTDCGHDESGAFFIVMELLEGMSLQDIMDRQGGMEIRRLAKIFMQICDGLDKAHSMGVVHRDLKPENIMLIEKDGRNDFVKIMDFGIAKIITDESAVSSLTQAGMIFGTPHFLSPEQAAGDDIDLRSDLYSLGVIFFYLATGKRPFDAETAGTLLRKHISSPPPLLTDLAPDMTFPDGLQTIISRLLKKNPEKRYPTATALKEQLNVMLGGGKILDGAGRDEEESSVEVTIETPEAPAEHLLDDEPMAAEPFRPSYAPPPISSSPVYRKMKARWMGDRKTQVVLAVFAAAAVIAVFITILVLTRTFPGEKGRHEEASPARIQAALEQKRAVFNEQPEITGALSLAVEDNGRALEALVPLESNPKFSENPHFYYHLAYLQVKTGKISSAVSTLEKCLALEPDYSYDPVVVELLVAGLKNEDSSEAAGDLLINNMTAPMKDPLEKIAREDENDGVRRIAITALKRKNLLLRLEAWKKSAIELADPDLACEVKKASFSKLLPVTDRELLPTLELIDSGRKCEGLRCSECLGEDLKKKIADLTPHGH